MKITRETINFNKEILFGEIGALIGVQAAGYIASLLTKNVNIISYSVVLGAIVASSIFWISMRAYDKSRQGNKYSPKKFANDIKYFTPMAASLTFLIYYPTLFFATKYFLEHNRIIEYPATISQIIAFGLFLTGINFYRYILNRYYGKLL